MNLFFDTKVEADIVNARVTQACIAASKWTDGLTNNYCNPYYDEELAKWAVPVLDGYEQFFNDDELQFANMTAPELQVMKNKAFGQRIMNKFIAMRSALPASPEDDLLVMDYSILGDVRELLYDGSIKSARARLIEKPNEVLPQIVREQFAQEMADYLIANGL